MINHEKILENIELILESLEIDYKKTNNRISFACPIHGGTKNSGATIYTNGYGIWKCWTNNCHEDIGKTILDLIQGCLSQNNGEFSKIDTVKWIEKVIGGSIDEELQSFSLEKRRTINLSLHINKVKNQPLKLISRNDVINGLEIPASYFIKRGYSKDVLKKYDIGLCNKKNKEMSYRVVAPVYDDDYKYMVGCIGRTQKPQCRFCNKYHNTNEICPASSMAEYCSSKWINSTGFNGENYLYNFWFAKHEICKKNTAILVEGAADVWRLEESDITIGLGLFGAHLTDKQAMKLESLSIVNLIIATDNDDAGNKARSLIKEKLWRHYNIIDVIPPKKDVGELSIQETKEIFYPILEKLNVV